MTEEKSLEGLGGWLIVVAFGLIVGPISMVIYLHELYQEIFVSGVWQELGVEDSLAYHPLWQPIIILEVVGNLVFLAVWIFIAVLFFTKKRSFPIWFIWATVATFVFVLVDALAVKIVLPDEPIFDRDTIKELGGAAFAIMIWVPYMRVSERVKATFVN